MAKKYHPSDLICYTYGRRNNIESLKAENVARDLHIKWINIEYNDDLVKNFISDPVFIKYYPYVSNLSSMFFMSDYFAVRFLKDKKIVPDECVFIPGHTGALTGSHQISGLNKPLSYNYLINRILSIHFSTIIMHRSKKSLIESLLSQSLQSSGLNDWKTYENWNLKERQAKFIINSSKVYLFFGFDYVMPLLDKSLMDFFSALPYCLKLNKILYHKVLKSAFFKNPDLVFKDERHDEDLRYKFQEIKDAVKTFLPYRLVTLLSDQRSIIFYDVITKYFRDDIGEANFIRPFRPNYYNAYIIQWYLFRTKELLKKLPDIQQV
jgi:asparagine synthase (glutamine-hydrolysing)